MRKSDLPTPLFYKQAMINHHMRYSTLAKWSYGLKVLVVAEAILFVSPYISRILNLDLPFLPNPFRSPYLLSFVFLISLASLRHSLKAYGLALSLWSVSSVQVLLFPRLQGQLQVGVDFLFVLLVLISSTLLARQNWGWKSLALSLPLYLVSLGLLSLLYLGETSFLSLLSSLERGLFPYSILVQELSTLEGRHWFLSGFLLLVGYVFLSSSYYQKPYSSLRSVGLTFPSIPILTTPVFLFLGYPPFPTLLNLISLVSLPLSLLPKVKAKPLQFGLLTSTVSLTISALLFLLGSGEALVFTASGGSVIPRGLTDPDKVKSKLVEAIKENRHSQAKRFVDFLNSVGISPSQLFCEASRNKNCVLALWLLERYTLSLEKCQHLKGVTDCVLYTGRIPTGVNQLLLALQKADRDSSEKLAGLVLAKSQDERTRDVARKILASLTQGKEEPLNLPSLSGWDPNLWVNRELYGYKVVKLVGKGGNAYVLLAERGGRQYAIKVPMISSSSKERTRASRLTFLDTAGESSKLQEISSKTEDMVTLYGVFVDQTAIREILTGKVETYLKSPPAIVMEFMGGGDVEGLLREGAVVNSRKWQSVVTFISLRVARALSVIHQEGYVHLDVKTRNIFFSSPPGRTGEEVFSNLLTGRVKAKLGDLGASKRVGDRLDQYTPEYCPVDQVEAMLSGKGANVKMDMYALGATMYKMLTLGSMNPPEVVKYMDDAVEQFFRRGDFKTSLEKAKETYARFYSSLNLPGVDPGLVKVIRELVNPDPERRPAAHQVITELEAILRKLEPRYTV